MKIYPASTSRPDYINTQITRSQRKFAYCKVSARDPLAYLHLLRRYRETTQTTASVGPILCLGTRNGREVDLFRTALQRPLVARLLAATELKVRGFLSPFDFLAHDGRSRHSQLKPHSVVGVEINPEAIRRDVWVGSFDEMPAHWTNQFGVVYSNSFDQAQDPHRTAAEWLRVTRPGGFLIIAFGIHKQPSATDPVGDLVLADVLKLFPGELMYYNAAGTLYAEAIIRKTA